MSASPSEAGFSAVEVVVGTVVLSIVMVMTYLIGTTLVKQAVTGAGTGVAAETGQSQMATIEQYLRGAISPDNAKIEYAASGLDPCGSGSAPSHATAVQYADDYFLELCSAPSNKTTCTSGNINNQNTSCPHLYLIFVDGSTCRTAYNQCTLKVVDLTATSPSKPTMFTSTTFRCPSSCRSDLSSSASYTVNGTTYAAYSPGGLTYKAGGATPAFPYLFGYYTGTYDSSNPTTNQWSGSGLSSVLLAHLDLQTLAVPVAPATSTQRYTEISDAVWLTGNAVPPT
jgi:hypothetical protein